MSEPDDFIIEVHGWAGAFAPHVYLRSYDVDARDGRGDSELTTDAREAVGFESFRAAFDAYRTQSTVHPIRETDGRPNRPLTAYTIEVVVRADAMERQR